MDVYYRFVDGDDRAHRLVFESDLINDPDVRSRLEAFNRDFVDTIARAVAEETGLPLPQARLLGRGPGLAGMAQVSARHWLGTDGSLDLNPARGLICRLAWHGISRFPRETGTAGAGAGADSC
jgi:hypothetical protein